MHWCATLHVVSGVSVRPLNRSAFTRDLLLLVTICLDLRAAVSQKICFTFYLDDFE